jgi:hypothetical protein
MLTLGEMEGIKLKVMRLLGNEGKEDEVMRVKVIR